MEKGYMKDKAADNRKIGIERIEKLFQMAEREFGERPERSHRYARLAKKIAMRYNIKLPARLKRKVCKKCGSYLVAGINSKTRISRGMKIVSCLECGSVARYPYSGRNLSKGGKL